MSGAALSLIAGCSVGSLLKRAPRVSPAPEDHLDHFHEQSGVAWLGPLQQGWAIVVSLLILRVSPLEIR